MLTLQSEIGRQKVFKDAGGRQSFTTFALTVKRAVVVTDLTPQSAAAVDYAVNLVLYFDARLTLLHVCPPLTYTEVSPGILTIAGNGVQRPNADLELLRLRAEIRRRGPRCDACLRCGLYAKEAFRVAADRAADLLVISEHHLSWFRSFTEEDRGGTFVIGAPCPLVVIADQPANKPRMRR